MKMSKSLHWENLNKQADMFELFDERKDVGILLGYSSTKKCWAVIALGPPAHVLGYYTTVEDAKKDGLHLWEDRSGPL